MAALTLLALAKLEPRCSWKDAQDPLLRIFDMMAFFRDHYDTRYAANTRETVRKQPIRHFLHASIISKNPDDPDRATNSPQTVYQVTPEFLDLLRSYGTKSWGRSLDKFGVQTRVENDPQNQKPGRAITIKLSSKKTVNLSPGRHNKLVRDICMVFAGKFTKKSSIAYVGDTAKKFLHVEKPLLHNLGIDLGRHGKIPDVIIYDAERNWVFLIEAVTSHGPIDSERRVELQRLFSNARPGMVYVTAFPDMNTMRKYAADISWQTEVWVADNPEHLIHFDGDRFLGPYDSL